MAQNDVSFSHYFDMEPSFNAAAVGKQAKLNITAAYALDMAGFEHNPKTMYAAADMPFFFLNSYHGAGAQFMNDKIGLFTHQRLALQYSYKHKLLGGTIAIGAQAGLLSESFDGSRLDLEEGGDNAFTSSELSGNGIDLGIGLYYIHGPWYAGVSAQHLNAPQIDLGERNELKIDATYYLTGGYNIKLRNPFLTIKPSFLVRTDGVAYRGDITARMVYSYEKRMLYGGVSYSPTNSVTFLIGGNFHGAVVGYSYELYTSAIAPGNGSHELYIGYQMDVNLVK
ncbi:MAG TPA: PorP/SprF family type IX secretion system membrane protein, partial [Prevotella sp.]